jgi:hypothetical protein
MPVATNGNYSKTSHCISSVVESQLQCPINDTSLSLCMISSSSLNCSHQFVRPFDAAMNAFHSHANVDTDGLSAVNNNLSHNDTEWVNKSLQLFV